MRDRRGVGWVVVMLVFVFGAAVSVRAHAQDASNAAEIVFEQGHQLMQAGKYAEACDAFERSQKLDPQIGTRYNIGLCSEKQGKLTSAWAAFREVAQRDTNVGRRADAQKRADALAPRLTKLLINAAASPTGFSVKVNATDVTNLLGIETPVDPGDYTVTATAPGYKDWSAKVSATGEGLTVTVAIPPMEKPQPVPPGTSAHSEPGKEETSIAHLESSRDAAAQPAPSSRKKLGLGLAIGGGALIAGGVVAGVLASGKWSDAKAVCGGSLNCANPDDAARANQLGDAASTRGDIATGLIGAGVVAAGVGAALWLTSPSESPHGVAIAPTAGGASITFAGSF
jgi:Tfp pilus assembly protein PilF